MSPASLVVRGRRVVTPDGVRPAAVHVAGERIARVAPWDDVPSEAAIVDAGDDVVMPGLVDTHVHANEPGRTEWEGLATATRAAAAGGVTTVLDMPLNSVPATTTVAALRAKAAAARGKLHVDVGLLGGVVPGNARELAALRGAGALGFKCFLVPSGVDEFPHATERDLRDALPELARLGAVLMAHCELPGPIDAATAAADPTPGAARRYATYLATRPAAAEREAVALLCRLAGEHGARVHVVHLSAASSLDVVREARARGVAVTVETCPHYLTFAAEEVPDGATEYKCAPPIRDAANREALWTALAAGEIDCVVSDHSPCPPAMKLPETGDFLRAWGGVASLQLGLAAVWTGMRARGLPLERLAAWMCERPARLAGLDGRKGRLAPGHDADLVVWDPDAAFVVDPARLHHRHPVTPYAGRRLHGAVRGTWVRGRRVYDAAAGFAPPQGVLLAPQGTGD